MKASVVDLRYKMKDVLGALRRRENVEILYHGKPIGTIVPVDVRRKKKDLRKHPFFGMHKHLGSTAKDVEKVMNKLRGPRYPRDI